MFYQPHDVTEALRIKADLGHSITVLAGRTDLIVLRNRGQWRPQHMFDLSRIATRWNIEKSTGSIRIGAGATRGIRNAPRLS